MNIGITNNNNTCYINCCLQLLFNIEELIEYFNVYDSENEIITNFIEIIKNLKIKRDKNKIFSIETFKTLIRNELKIKINEQFDAHEFLIHLLNFFHEKIKGNIKICKKDKTTKTLFFENFFKNDFSIIKKLFYSQLESVVQCICGKSINREIIFELILNPVVSVQSSLDNFLLDKFECSKCHTQKQILKNFEIPSKYIFIVLSRFEDDLDNFFINKEISISYNIKYQLIGVINHMGNNTGGHYLASIKKNGIEYTINDEHVFLKTSNTFDKYAYILLYKKIENYTPFYIN